MFNLTTTHLNEAARRFADAFANDAIHGHFFPDARRKPQQVQALYRYKLALHRAHVVVTSDRLEGIAIWEPPHAHATPPTLAGVGLGVRLIQECGPSAVWRMARYQRWATRLRDGLVDEPFWYLDVIAVGPEFQGRGFANRLIRPILAKARETGSRVYLETQNPANVAIYEKQGFQVVLRSEVGGSGIPHFCMVTPE